GSAGTRHLPLRPARHPGRFRSRALRAAGRRRRHGVPAHRHRHAGDAGRGILLCVPTYTRTPESIVTQLSLVIPAYNEAESLPLLLEEIRAVCEAHSIDYEVIVVDDGSTD